jgi:hypothetical protein
VYVVESGARRVQHLTAKGRPLASWGTQGRNDGQFLEPIGVAVAPSGEVLVVGVWPADPSPDQLGALAVDGDHVWVAAPYPSKLFELKVSRTS